LATTSADLFAAIPTKFVTTVPVFLVAMLALLVVLARFAIHTISVSMDVSSTEPFTLPVT
jgi:hypothetical protein